MGCLVPTVCKTHVVQDRKDRKAHDYYKVQTNRFQQVQKKRILKYNFDTKEVVLLRVVVK